MEGYVPNYIEEIKRRLSIVDVVGQRVSLKKSGRNFKGLCPFHAEKSGSFYVWPDSESYFCFGCKESGDIFNFLMKTEGLSFGEVLTQLAARTGVTLPERQPQTPQETHEAQERDRLRAANTAAATYFQHLLLNSKEGQTARDYLAKRGIKAEAVESFALGYAVDSWDALFKYLTGKGFTPQELVTAGLVGARENGDGYYDRFRGRLIFPIRDRAGQIIAFGGRVLEGAPKDSPKYLNSPQTPLFDKGATLYGFDLAKDAIRRSDRAVIVEGYVDVIMAHQHGYANVVAPLGTALGEKHIGLLKKLTKRIVLALDADSAGQMATLKGIEVLKQGFDSKTVPVPTPQGLIRFEQHLDADIKIATLPPGKDPDEVIQEGGGKWRELIERALPVVDYYFSSVLASIDVNTSKGKIEAIEALAPVISEINNRIERSTYIKKLKQRIQATDSDYAIIDARILEASKLRKTHSAKNEELTPDTSISDDAVLEKPIPNTITPRNPLKLKLPVSLEVLEREHLVLAFLLRYWTDVLDVKAADDQPVRITDFIRSENKLIFEAVSASGGSIDRDSLQQYLAPELLDYFEKLLEYAQSEPELIDILSRQETMRYQLDHLREARLQQVYVEGSYVLEEEEEEEEQASQEKEDIIFIEVTKAISQLKLFYPRPSPLFKDSRDR